MHQPVLLQPTIESLEIKEGEIVVDATLGLGGHAKEICRRLGTDGTLFGLDQDSAALAKAKANLADCPARQILKQGNFRYLPQLLTEEGIDKINIALFDLGFNSEQMELSGRGFTFQKDEPLLMTLTDQFTPETLTAERIVNTWAEENLADIIYGYGEERSARKIAKAIVTARTKKPITTTLELVEVIRQALPTWATRPGHRIHFATKTFQALRLTVNDELGALTEGLTGAWDKLAVGGRIAVISFHSLEARLVKKFMQEKVKASVAEMITKKVIKPSREEIISNSRSRSAQLRVIKKIC